MAAVPYRLGNAAIGLPAILKMRWATCVSTLSFLGPCHAACRRRSTRPLRASFDWIALPMSSPCPDLIRGLLRSNYRQNKFSQADGNAGQARVWRAALIGTRI
jgi:hypothetical protein